MAAKKGQAATDAVNQEGAAPAAPASNAPRRYRCAQLVTLQPSIGDLYLTKEQKERLFYRYCVTPGSVEGSDRITQPVDFKKGEEVTLGARPPKVLWHAFGGEPGEEPKAL